MTIPQAEWLLLALLLALYLYDSAHLLAANESAFSVDRHGCWQVHFGAEHFPLKGREPLLAQPLAPWRPLFLLRWSMQGSDGQTAAWNEEALRAFFRRLTPWVMLQMVGLFGMLPLGLLTRLGYDFAALGLLLFYAAAGVALTLSWRQRQDLQLSSRQFAGLAFECLSCPPFALNLVRHLSWRLPVGESLLQAAQRLLPLPAQAAVRAAILRRLESALAWEEENTAASQAMQSYRQTLLDEAQATDQPMPSGSPETDPARSGQEDSR